jgi:hypothetical protein
VKIWEYGNVGIHLHIYKSAYFQIFLIACPAVAEPVEAPKDEDVRMGKEATVF